MHSRSARSGQGTRLRDALPFLRKAYAFFRLRFASSTNDGGKQASVLTSAHSLLMGSCRDIQTGYWLHLTTKPRPPASSCLRPPLGQSSSRILRRGVLERPLGEVHVAAHYGLLSVGSSVGGAFRPLDDARVLGPRLEQDGIASGARKTPDKPRHRYWASTAVNMLASTRHALPPWSKLRSRT